MDDLLLRRFLLVLAVQLTAGPLLAQTSGTPSWKVSTSHTGMGDSSWAISLDAVAPIQGRVREETPALVIRCRKREGRKEIETFVAIGMAASVEEGELHTVRMRFDDGNPKKDWWSEATSLESLFSIEGEKLAKRLGKTKIFRFEFTPYQMGPVVAEFNLADLNTYLSTVFSFCDKKL